MRPWGCDWRGRCTASGTRAHLTEGRRWLDEALAKSNGMPPPARAKALIGAGVIAREQGDYDGAVGLREESLALWREEGDGWWTAYTLIAVATTADLMGKHERAVSLLEEALGLFRELGDEEGVVVTLNNLGATTLFRDDHERVVGRL